MSQIIHHLVMSWIQQEQRLLKEMKVKEIYIRNTMAIIEVAVVFDTSADTSFINKVWAHLLETFRTATSGQGELNVLNDMTWSEARLGQRWGFEIVKLPW